MKGNTSEPPRRSWIAQLFPNSRSARQQRLRFIDDYTFPHLLLTRFATEHPELDAGQRALVWNALREYFRLCLLAEGKMVAMPSRIVDEAWHEFILFTRDYESFCRAALGRFLHHTPAAAPSAAFLRNPNHLAWELSCRRTRQNPAFPVYLPVLYAIDTQLARPGHPAHDLETLAENYRHHIAVATGRKATPQNHKSGHNAAFGGGCAGSGCGGGSCGDGGCGDGGSCGGGSCGG